MCHAAKGPWIVEIVETGEFGEFVFSSKAPAAVVAATPPGLDSPPASSCIPDMAQWRMESEANDDVVLSPNEGSAEE